MKRFLLILMTFVMMFSLTACSNGSFLSEDDIMDISKNPQVTITLEYDLDDGLGKREVALTYELYYEKAPSTVANFIQLAEDKYYDGKIIDWAQINDEAGDLSYITGGQYKLNDDGEVVNDAKNYKIKGEFVANQWTANDLQHGLGALVMDRDYGNGEAFDSASTRFYMVLNDNYQRQRNYCVFGQLVSSQLTLDSVAYASSKSIHNQFLADMANIETEAKDIAGTNDRLSQVPVHNIVFKSVVVNTFGEDFSKAKVAKA